MEVSEAWPEPASTYNYTPSPPYLSHLLTRHYYKLSPWPQQLNSHSSSYFPKLSGKGTRCYLV